MLRAAYGRVIAHPEVAPVKPAWQRSRLTTAPLRFLARERLRRCRGATYRLRSAPGVPLALRHGTRDPETLDQIFLQRAVAEPPAVSELLAALGRPPRIIDLGANVGISAAWFAARWPRAEILCVEPDPDNTAVLRRAAAVADPRWQVVEAAAGSASGTTRMTLRGDTMSRASARGGQDVATVDFFALAGQARPDVVKVDVEGGEWALLRDPRLAGLAVLAMHLEVHPHLCGGARPRDEAVALLRAAGFAVVEVPHVAGAGADEASLWAWRPQAGRAAEDAAARSSSAS